MNFLNPAILFGLFAAAIPLILHLLNLRKLKRVEFSSLKFMKELQKNKIRKVKLKQIILLILRTLIIAFIVLAFARPTIKSELPLGGTYAKSSIVILLDNSFSMDVSDEFGNRFKQARKAAKKILNSLRDGDEAAIVPMTAGSDFYSLSRNHDELSDELERLEISYSTASLFNSLNKAYNILAESNNLNREIYVITDAQSNVFDYPAGDSLRFYAPNTSIYIIGIGGNSKMQLVNVSVDSVDLITRIFQRDIPVEINATIKNNSSDDVSGLVTSLFINKERASQMTVDIHAGQKSTVQMSGEPKEFGIIDAYVEIESDALDHDNRRYIGFFIPEKPHVALFANDNILPVETVLQLNKDQIQYDKFKTAQLTSIDLSRYDLLIIDGTISKTTAFERLRKYIEAGGNVLMFAALNEDNFSLYARDVQTLGITIKTLKEYDAGNPLKFNYTDKLHPLFKGVFTGISDGRKQVESPEIHKMVITNSGQKIISTQAGNFLSEIRLGKGKLFFVSTSLSPQASNFALTGLFPVFLYRSVFYLTAKEYTGVSVNTGDVARVVLPKKFAEGGKLKIIDPNGRETFVSPALLPTSAILELSNLNIPGIYAIYTSDGRVVNIVTVNNNSSESAIKTLDNDEISKRIGNFVDNRTEIRLLQVDDLSENFERARTGTELWQLFVFLALAAAIAEMIVARTSKNELIEE